MAKSSSSAGAGSTASTEEADAVSGKLRDALERVDGLSQLGFTQIASMARAATVWLTRPMGTADLEVVIDLLELIRDRAETIQDDINCEAENYGCNYVDAMGREQRHAWRRWRGAAGQDAGG